MLIHVTQMVRHDWAMTCQMTSELKILNSSEIVMRCCVAKVYRCCPRTLNMNNNWGEDDNHLSWPFADTQSYSYRDRTNEKLPRRELSEKVRFGFKPTCHVLAVNFITWHKCAAWSHEHTTVITRHISNWEDPLYGFTSRQDRLCHSVLCPDWIN